MNEHAMTQGVIPVRHSSLAGLVKLPKRYEKAALGDNRTARYRKVSICAGQQQLRDAMTERLEDLTMAVMWVKQELILLRQHDILLKRQFFNIHDSIQSLQSRSSQLTRSPSTSISIVSINDEMKDLKSTSGSTQLTCPSHTPLSREQGASTLLLPNDYSDYRLETLLVRPAVSTTILNSKNEDSEDSDGGDMFFEYEYYRPRTSSMRTSRDLAALARRRGSKELI